MLTNEKMFTFYSSIIRKGDLCFDIGANIGTRTEVFVSLGARVVSVEPQQSCFRILESKFSGSDVILVNKALGEREGTAEFFISNADTISSLSKEWIWSVTNSGRFSSYSWNEGCLVQVTTMDALIAQYGKPSFCKVDVEGFEYEVLRGLSSPIGMLSFEFTPEHLGPTINCISRLGQMGPYRFNYSLMESMELASPEWVSEEQIIRMLLKNTGMHIFGDVYARLTV